MRLVPVIAALLVLAVVIGSPSTAAVKFTAINVTNNSSPNELSGQAEFRTQSTLTMPAALDDRTTFTHRMGFYNQYTAWGGASQEHKRDIVYQIDFAVEDPNSLGFNLETSSWLHGSSIIRLGYGTPASASATGASFSVEVDDSTDASDTFSDVSGLFNSTSGVSLSAFGSRSVTTESMAIAYLGSYVGTTQFSFIFSTTPTLTTNVIFDYNNLGSGEIDYYSSSNFFGHYVTFTATFVVPEPAPVACIWGIALVVTCCRRQSRRLSAARQRSYTPERSEFARECWST